MPTIFFYPRFGQNGSPSQTRPLRDAEALPFYRHQLGRPVSGPQAQNAQASLPQRSPALVWKSARGEYAVEDAAMHRWDLARVNAAEWPQVPAQGDFELEEE